MCVHVLWLVWARHRTPQRVDACSSRCVYMWLFVAVCAANILLLANNTTHQPRQDQPAQEPEGCAHTRPQNQGGCAFDCCLAWRCWCTLKSMLLCASLSPPVYPSVARSVVIHTTPPHHPHALITPPPQPSTCNQQALLDRESALQQDLSAARGAAADACAERDALKARLDTQQQVRACGHGWVDAARVEVGLRQQSAVASHCHALNTHTHTSTSTHTIYNTGC